MYLSVDLASKFSAWIVTDEKSKVHTQGDSSGLTPIQVADEIANLASTYNVKLVLIEDVPYGISGQFQTKPVLRLQGIIIKAIHQKNPELLERTLWINPSTWQRSFEGVARGLPADRLAAAKQHAKQTGYTAPDLVGEYISTLPEGKKPLKKHTNPLEKTQSDYVDAWLISIWLRANLDTLQTISGVQPTII